ncbi:MAG: protein kinase [Anaerolineae bacterium]|jgi:serine/threonine-protein kinase
MAASLIGRKVGQYQVVAELGRGQHSVVYKAWQTSLGRLVALKVLHHYDQDTLEKFRAEARLTAQLIQQGVPNIRQVYEVGQTSDGYLFVALEYINDSLQNVLRRAKQRNRRMNPTSAAKLLQPVAEALNAIHNLGWVHLDIKPQNILITRGGRAVLADFGIAQRRGTQTHACTPAYASPEQAAGDRPVGPWSDIYSLGVVLYEMIAGHLPVRGDQDVVLLNQHLEVTPPSPRRVNPRLLASQERALFKALAKPSKERYETAGDFVQELLAPDSRFSSVLKTPRIIRNTTSSLSPRTRRLALVSGILVLLLAVLYLVNWVLWPGWLFSGMGATGTAVVETVVVTPVPPTASPTGSVWATATPTATTASTVTLAPTPSRTPRPTATPTRKPQPTPSPTP